MSAKYNYELIKDYLDGILDTKTSQMISHQIENDEIARDIAKGILLLDDHFNQDDEKIEQYLQDRLATQEQVIEKVNSKKQYPVLKIAASFALIAISWFGIHQLTQPSMDEVIGNELSTPYEITITLRDSESAQMDQAVINYQNGNYLKTYELLNDKHDAQAVFYKGISLLYAGEYDKAIANLESTNLASSRYEQQGRWFLALAYLKAGKNESAYQILERISASNSHYKKAQAIKLFNYLDD